MGVSKDPCDVFWLLSTSVHFTAIIPSHSPCSATETRGKDLSANCFQMEIKNNHTATLSKWLLLRSVQDREIEAGFLFNVPFTTAQAPFPDYFEAVWGEALTLHAPRWFTLNESEIDTAALRHKRHCLLLFTCEVCRGQHWRLCKKKRNLNSPLLQLLYEIRNVLLD